MGQGGYRLIHLGGWQRHGSSYSVAALRTSKNQQSIEGCPQHFWPTGPWSAVFRCLYTFNGTRIVRLKPRETKDFLCCTIFPA